MCLIYSPDKDAQYQHYEEAAGLSLRPIMVKTKSTKQRDTSLSGIRLSSGLHQRGRTNSYGPELELIVGPLFISGLYYCICTVNTGQNCQILRAKAMLQSRVQMLLEQAFLFFGFFYLFKK